MPPPRGVCKKVLLDCTAKRGEVVKLGAEAKHCTCTVEDRQKSAAGKMCANEQTAGRPRRAAAEVVVVRGEEEEEDALLRSDTRMLSNKTD